MIDTHFNSAIKVINDAKRKGALLFLDGENVKIKVEKNKVIEHEFFEEVKKYKNEIRTILSNKSARENIIPGKKNLHSDRIPLSYSQERLWFIHRLEGSVAYHIRSVLRLEGSLDAGA